MAKSERKTNFIGGIIWLLVASCVVTLSLRLGYDVLGKQPVGNLTSWLYDISNTLLLPLSWIENYIELPKTFASLSLTIPLAIGLYVLVGWLVMAIIGRNRA